MSETTEILAGVEASPPKPESRRTRSTLETLQAEADRAEAERAATRQRLRAEVERDLLAEANRRRAEAEAILGRVQDRVAMAEAAVRRAEAGHAPGVQVFSSGMPRSMKPPPLNTETQGASVWMRQPNGGRRVHVLTHRVGELLAQGFSIDGDQDSPTESEEQELARLERDRARLEAQRNEMERQRRVRERLDETRAAIAALQAGTGTKENDDE